MDQALASMHCRSHTMKTSFAYLLALATLTGCASRNIDTGSARTPTAAASTDHGGNPREATATSYDAYKRVLALHISETNSTHVYPGRPQALLRSVVVLKYAIDARGNLVRSDIMRSNRDAETETTALSTLRKSAPFPQPAPHLLRRGQIDIIETWLFNNDGRFQLRTVAQPQMDS